MPEPVRDHMNRDPGHQQSRRMHVPQVMEPAACSGASLLLLSRVDGPRDSTERLRDVTGQRGRPKSVSAEPAPLNLLSGQGFEPLGDGATSGLMSLALAHSARDVRR